MMLDDFLARYNAILLIFFAGAAVSIVIGFYWGRRRNLALIREFSQEMETALRPLDQTYTWLGGEIGFRADYQTEGEFSSVEATCTMLPRQSVLYFPIARVITGFDRLYVLFRVQKNIKEEAHILDPWYGKTRGQKIQNRSNLYAEQIQVGPRTFELLFRNSRIATEMKSFLGSLERPDLLKHLAINPDTQTIYLLMVPRPVHVRNYLSHTIRLIRQIT